MSRRSGILVVDKAPGATSFDAVALTRRRLGLRRVGHAGTLDPAAAGVLPLLLGEATKLMAYLADQDKEYVVTLRLGLTTDTHDLGGRVVATAAPPVSLDRATVAAACRPLLGRIRQVPPMYSALHYRGRRLYELAREGMEVERAPRDVVVHALDVEAVQGAEARLRVVCGKGTYIRALAADLGAALGCGAAVASLVRTRVGPFTLEAAVSWPQLSEAPAAALWSRVLPPDAALDAWQAVRLDPAAAAAFTHGQRAVVASPPVAGGFVRVYDASATFLGVGELVASGAAVRPVRLLHADRPEPRVLPG